MLPKLFCFGKIKGFAGRNEFSERLASGAEGAAWFLEPLKHGVGVGGRRTLHQQEGEPRGGGTKEKLRQEAPWSLTPSRTQAESAREHRSQARRCGHTGGLLHTQARRGETRSDCLFRRDRCFLVCPPEPTTGTCPGGRGMRLVSSPGSPVLYNTWSGLRVRAGPSALDTEAYESVSHPLPLRAGLAAQDGIPDGRQTHSPASWRTWRHENVEMPRSKLHVGEQTFNLRPRHRP